MLSILDFDPDFALSSMGNEILKKWQRCLVSFHCAKPHHPNVVLTIGTGFVACMGNELTIATALHVVSDYIDSGQGLGAIVGGHHISLDGARFLGSAQEDCAFLEIPRSLPANSLAVLKSGRRPEMLVTSSFIVFGYPETRNRFDLRQLERTPHVHSIVSHSFSSDPSTGTLTFPYDPKNIYIETTSAGSGPPHLKGMSGSPVAQLLVNPNTGTVGLRLVGIFIRWTKSGKSLVAHCFPDFGRELHGEWDRYKSKAK